MRLPGARNGERQTVKIEVLYVCDCPNHSPTLARIQQVLAAEGLRFPVHEVLVSSESEAKALEFIGSPTVRVNGIDVEPVELAMPGLSCRIYADSSGIPSQESLKRAITEARE
jgi:hypothetical protein